MRDEIPFGTWLRKQRRALDLSQQAFADQVGCAEVTRRRIEAGMLKPSKELANILLEKLGIPETERPQWISFARGISSFPSQSIPSPNKPLTNLPAPLTTFIGREKEQSGVIRLTTQHRLVTLTGSGGVGKTRLSIKVGEQVLEDYADGIWLVELAAILDPLLVPRTTAIAIGLRDEPQRPVTDMLSDYLREKQILIILDNCEHLLDSCAQLADTLLKRCPGLKILATSRESLGILGDAVYRVPSLELPDIQQFVENLRGYEAIQLFEERAQLAQMDFTLTKENAISVAKICSRLDGIPLAIELAAARVNMFATEQIAQRLQESFDLLTTGNRTALPRHQTLQAAIDWSYNLLSQAEQTLFQRLSIFVSGWTLEAAQSVCSDNNIMPGMILDLLTELTNKSLVIMQEKQVGTRFRMLETIRQYANEKLLQEDNEIIYQQYLAYFVKLAEQAGPNLFHANQVFWWKRLTDEIDNFRIALQWSLVIDVRSGLRILAFSALFWQSRGYRQEARQWLAQLLDLYDVQDFLRVQALITFCFCTDDLVERQRIAEQSLRVARALSDKQAEARSLWNLGGVILFQGNIREGVALVEQSLALYQNLGDKIGQANAMRWLSLNNNLGCSKALLIEALRLYRESDHLWGIAECLSELAHLMIWEGDLSSPAQWLEESRTIYRELGDQLGEASVLQNFGTLFFWQGNYQQAITHYEAANILYEKVGHYSNILWSRVNQSYALLRHGDIAKAKAIFEFCLQGFHKVNNLIGLVFTMEGLASLHVNQERPEHAIKLLAWADTIRGKINDYRPPIEQKFVDGDLAIIHSKLNDAEFAKSSTEGCSMTIEQAMALALEPAE